MAINPEVVKTPFSELKFWTDGRETDQLTNPLREGLNCQRIIKNTRNNERYESIGKPVQCANSANHFIVSESLTFTNTAHVHSQTFITEDILPCHSLINDGLIPFSSFSFSILILCMLVLLEWIGAIINVSSKICAFTTMTSQSACWMRCCMGTKCCRGFHGSEVTSSLTDYS